MAKRPSNDALLFAADFVEAYEGGDTDEANVAHAAAVAEWLRDLVAKAEEREGVDSVIKELAAKHNVTVKRMREIVKQRLAEQKAKKEVPS